MIVGDDTGIVRAFDRGSGAPVWEYVTEGEISGGPTIIAGPTGDRVLVGSQDASLSCLALADGELIWKHSIADQIRCSPTVARGAAGDRVFIAGCDGRLHVIDADTGKEAATVPIDGPTGTTPAASADRAASASAVRSSSSSGARAAAKASAERKRRGSWWAFSLKSAPCEGRSAACFVLPSFFFLAATAAALSCSDCLAAARK